jgi:CubicO group peptidase (beta-lactamase class C family)
MNLVGAALTAATGTWLPALFARDVAGPLGIERYAFNLMPTGDGYVGGGLRLRARDLLKLGIAYLDGGVWNGRRLVDSAWVVRSTTLQMASEAGGDGFAWHLNTLASGGRNYREFEATGNGGQLLIVLPELDLAIAITAGNYGMYGVWRKFRTEMVPDEIIPAVRGR